MQRSLVALICSLALLTACSPARSLPTHSVSASPVLSAPSTATPTPTDIPPLLPTATATWVPTATVIPRFPITSANAKDIQLLHTLPGIAGTDIAWSPNASLLAVASDYGIILFDAATLQNVSTISNDLSDLATLPPHILFSRDGSRILIWGWSNDTQWYGQVFDVGSGSEIAKIHKLSEAADFCPAGKILTSGQGLFCASPASATSVYGLTLSISSDGLYSATDTQHNIDVSRLDARGIGRTIWQSTYNYPWGYGGGYGPASAVFSADSKLMAAGFSGGDIHIYAVLSGREQGSLIVGNRVSGLSFSPDGSRLAYSSGTGSGVIDLRSNYRVTELGGVSPGSISDMDFSPDGRWFATSNQANAVMLWDAASNQLVDAWTMPPGAVSDHMGWFTCMPWAAHIAFSPDGQRLALVRKGALQMMDISQHKALYARGGVDATTSIAFSPDGGLVATGTSFSSSGKDNLMEMPAVQIYRASDGGQVSTLRGLSRATFSNFPRDWNFNCVVGMAFSPDSRTLAVADMNSIKFWDPNTGQRVWQNFDAQMSMLMEIEFSRDGSMFAAIDYYGKAKLWQIQNGQVERYPTREWNGLEFGHLAFSPDSSLIAFVYWDRPLLNLDIWETTKNHRVLSKTIGSGVNSFVSLGSQISFSPDGELLAVATRGGIPGIVRIYGVTP